MNPAMSGSSLCSFTVNPPPVEGDAEEVPGADTGDETDEDARGDDDRLHLEDASDGHLLCFLAHLEGDGAGHPQGQQQVRAEAAHQEADESRPPAERDDFPLAVDEDLRLRFRPLLQLCETVLELVDLVAVLARHRDEQEERQAPLLAQRGDAHLQLVDLVRLLGQLRRRLAVAPLDEGGDDGGQDFSQLADEDTEFARRFGGGVGRFDGAQTGGPVGHFGPFVLGCHGHFRNPFPLDRTEKSDTTVQSRAWDGYRIIIELF